MPTSTFSFTERRLVFSSSSVPPQFCESLTAQSHGKVSHLIWDRNCMKLFSCVGKTEFCKTQVGGMQATFMVGGAGWRKTQKM